MGGRRELLRLVSINDVYELTHLSKIGTLLRKLAHGPQRLVSVIAGDFVSPSVLSSFDSGKGMIDSLNKLNVTHACFGNHEADIGLSELKKRVGEFQGTWLNSNMRGFKHPKLKEYDIITTPAGRKIALIGLLLDGKIGFKSGDFKGIPVEPVLATAVDLCARLRKAENVDLIVPITHQSLQDDKELAKALGVPLILGGHDHEVMSVDVGSCRIVKSGSNAEYATVCDLEFEDKPIQVNVPINLSNPSPTSSVTTVLSTRLEDVRNLPADPVIQACVDSHMEVVRMLENEVVCWAEQRQTHLLPLSSKGSRLQQTTLGMLFANAGRDLFKADCAMINGGSIAGKREYPAGELSLLDLKRELPYPTKIVCAHLPGGVISAAVRHSRRHGDGPERRGYLQCDDGMSIDSDSDHVTHIAGRPLDPANVYNVALPRNLLAGFCEIQPLTDYARTEPAGAAAAADDHFMPALNVVLSAYARRTWRKLGSFGEMDSDGSGYIDRGELRAAVRRRLGREPTEVMLDNMMAALDENKDGVVSREELAAAVAG